MHLSNFETNCSWTDRHSKSLSNFANYCLNTAAAAAKCISNSIKYKLQYFPQRYKCIPSFYPQTEP